VDEKADGAAVRGKFGHKKNAVPQEIGKLDGPFHLVFSFAGWFRQVVTPAKRES
jgi:hypothetical protein